MTVVSITPVQSLNLARQTSLFVFEGTHVNQSAGTTDSTKPQIIPSSIKQCSGRWSEAKLLQTTLERQLCLLNSGYT